MGMLIVIYYFLKTTMEKKEYVTPDMEAVDIELNQMVCMSDPVAPDPNEPWD